VGGARGGVGTHHVVPETSSQCSVTFDTHVEAVRSKEGHIRIRIILFLQTMKSGQSMNFDIVYTV